MFSIHFRISIFNVEDGLVELSTPNGQCQFQIRAVPLPENVTKLLDENTSILSLIEQAQGRDDRKARIPLNDQALDQIRQLKEKLAEAFASASGNLWKGNTVDEILSFGPQRCGPNLLINRIPKSNYRKTHSSIWDVALNNPTQTELSQKDDYDLSIISGFQLATAKGSLCEEPLMGVGFILERWVINTIVADDSTEKAEEEQQPTTDGISASEDLESFVETVSLSSEDTSAINVQQKPIRVINKSKVLENRGPLSGQIVSTVLDGCRRAFDSQPRRLVAAMFKCELMVTAEALGLLYSS